MNALLLVGYVVAVVAWFEVSERIHEAREQRVEDRARLARELEQLQQDGSR